MNFFSQNQYNTSVCSNVSFNADTKKVTDHRSSSVRFKETEFERSESSKGHPIWRPAFETDAEAPQYRAIKPILTPTTGRSSAISTGPSPIPANEFEKPQRFTSTNEQLTTVTRDFHVLKPKPVAARPIPNQSKPYTKPTAHSPQFYTAVAGPPFHNQKGISEDNSHMEMHESTESSSQHIVTTSTSRKVITFDQQQQQLQQQQHQQQHQKSYSSFEKQMEPFPFSVSPTSSMHSMRQKLRPPPTPTKFVPGELRESDYDSEIESLKIRPIWTPNPCDPEQVHYRHVSPPTPNRCGSVPRHHFERIVTPMEFDTNTVEMPTPIKPCLPTSCSPYGGSSSYANQFKTQTLDRFRSKKKTSSQYRSTSQDDINVMHSTPKYSRSRSPAQPRHDDSQTSQTYREETRSTQYGKFDKIFFPHYFAHI